MRTVKRVVVTFLSFLASGIIIALWQEFLPSGGISGALMALITVALVFGTWKWSGTYFASDSRLPTDRPGLICTALLAYLHDRFPAPASVKLNDLSLDEWLNSLNEKELWEWHNTFTEMVRWLGTEGFLRANEEPGGEEFSDVVLTNQGMEKLRGLPSPIGIMDKPAIDQLKAALLSGSALASMEAIRTIVREATGAAISDP